MILSVGEDDEGEYLDVVEDDDSALYNFFSRYYDEGDFISKRRYKEGTSTSATSDRRTSP